MRLLHEQKNVKQYPGEPCRRLFWDDYFQLCVWVDDQNTPLGFELSYDLAGDCRAFRCLPGPAVEHYTVDDGESRALRKATPILRADNSRIDHQVADEFHRRSHQIDAAIAGMVSQRLQAFLDSTPNWSARRRK